jgi:hypothetical protein
MTGTAPVRAGEAYRRALRVGYDLYVHAGLLVLA